MVLVKSQAEVGDREIDKTFIIGLQTIPLHQQVEGCHGKGQAGTEVAPNPMHYLFEMANQSKHREDRLHHHALIPLTPPTQLQVGWVSCPGVKAQVSEDGNQFLESGYQR